MRGSLTREGRWGGASLTGKRPRTPYGGRADLQLEDFPFGKLRFGAPLTGPTQFRAHKLPPPAGGRDAIYATSAPIYRVADLQKSDGGRLNCVRTLGARNSLSPPSRVCPVRDANPSGRRPPLCYLRSHIYGSGPKENYICPRFSTKNAEISKKIEDFLRYNFLREKGVRRSASCSKGFTRLTRKSLRQALRTREGSDLITL